MFYIIKNISADNIVIGKIFLQAGSETKIYDLDPFKKMIDKGYLIIKNIPDNEIIDNVYIDVKTLPVSILSNEQSQTEIRGKATIEIKDKFISDTIRQNIMEGFFNFYISKDVSEKDLKFLKWFYKNVGFTNKVNPQILNLLDEADNYEDLTTILLNNVYPELLKNYIIAEKK